MRGLFSLENIASISSVMIQSTRMYGSHILLKMFWSKGFWWTEQHYSVQKFRLRNIYFKKCMLLYSKDALSKYIYNVSREILSSTTVFNIDINANVSW